MLVECFLVGCGIILFFNLIGGVKLVVLVIGVYVYICCQFKIFIGKMEGIEELLVCIVGNVYVMDVVVLLIIYGIMFGEKFVVLLVIVKYYCIYCGQQLIIDVMDIIGGKGIMFG